MTRAVLSLCLALSVSPAAADPLTEALDRIFKPSPPATVKDYLTVRRIPRAYYRNAATTPIIHAPVEGGVNSMIASRVSSEIGPQWVSTALRIAHIESGGNCGAVNRSGATGVFQVIHPERFGVSRSAARTCAGGIAAGVAHMRHCIANGARTSAQLMACHNSGDPFTPRRRLEAAYREALR